MKMNTINGNPKERLIVKDKGRLHLLGRFFQAMIMNFMKKPDKVRIIEGLNLMVAFNPTHQPENALPLNFKEGRVILECGIRPNAYITIIGEPAVLMMLSRMPAGLAVIKYFKTYEGRDLIARLRSGELKIKGVFKNPFRSGLPLDRCLQFFIARFLGCFHSPHAP